MMKWQDCVFSFIKKSGKEEQKKGQQRQTPATGDIVWDRKVMLNEVSLVMYLLRLEYFLLLILPIYMPFAWVSKLCA